MIDIPGYKLEHAMVVEAMGSDDYWKDALVKNSLPDCPPIDEVDLLEKAKERLKEASIAESKRIDELLIKWMQGVG
jgi:hypothetical protein